MENPASDIFHCRRNLKIIMFKENIEFTFKKLLRISDVFLGHCLDYNCNCIEYVLHNIVSDQFFITQKVKWGSPLPFGGPWGGTPGAGGIPIVGGTPIGGKPNGGCGPCGGGGCWGCGGGLRTSILHVGQVCCLWNHDRKQLVWNMWLQGSFLQPVVISSRHMMHTLSPCWSSSGEASGYLTEAVLKNKIKTELLIKAETVWCKESSITANECLKRSLPQAELTGCCTQAALHRGFNKNEGYMYVWPIVVLVKGIVKDILISYAATRQAVIKQLQGSMESNSWPLASDFGTTLHKNWATEWSWF